MTHGLNDKEMSMKRICGAVVLAFAFAATLSSQSLPTATPESVGISTDRKSVV